MLSLRSRAASLTYTGFFTLIPLNPPMEECLGILAVMMTTEIDI